MQNWKRSSDYWIKLIKQQEGNVKKLFLLLMVVWKFTAADAVDFSRDTVIIGKQLTDTLEVETVKLDLKPHSPHKATIYAMVLPGLGQIYNRQWWKLPILYGGVGATVYGISWNSRNFKKYQAAYSDYSHYLTEKAKDPDFPYPENPSWEKVYVGGGVEDFSPQQQSNFQTQLKNRKTDFKRNRDLLYIVMGGIYAIQIIDACVFAHFYDFEINEDLSLNLQPNTFFTPAAGGMVGLSLTLNF